MMAFPACKLSNAEQRVVLTSHRRSLFSGIVEKLHLSNASFFSSALFKPYESFREDADVVKTKKHKFKAGFVNEVGNENVYQLTGKFYNAVLLRKL